MLNKLVQVNRITLGGLGADPSRWAIFVIFWQKNSQFSAVWNTFHTISESFEWTKLLNFQSHLKKLNLLSFSSLSPLSPLLTGQVQILVRSKTRLNALNVLDLISPLIAPLYYADKDYTLSKKQHFCCSRIALLETRIALYCSLLLSYCSRIALLFSYCSRIALI